MPATSRAQQKLMQIAEHHPSQVYARNRGVLKMSHRQLHDFSVGSEKSKPYYARHTRTGQFKTRGRTRTYGSHDWTYHS